MSVCILFVNFICVCSNIQKIIESIQSRLYVFRLENLTIEQNKLIMNNIIEKENMKVNAYIKNYLITISDNNIRHIIHNLEEVHFYDKDKISINQCRELCSNISIEPFEKYILFIKMMNYMKLFVFFINITIMDIRLLIF